jgi:hypothetical protein
LEKKMPTDPATIVYNLLQNDPSIIAAAVVQGSDTILYSTDNWDISADISRVV